ncbi:DUF4468 domain-containing protein [Arcicella aquatica]|uniref:DUF4468 domain-containing protein n=1 Tax=Arcicella aquatica TaxID=217141 RepID=A0ABU5QU57_9BACT|nr:DUF4468 domain-containing protein [Arcicella aquatica]MEA5260641.1 DUF4468 domain-containing protein [Arcicella aquatica]
MKKTLIIALSLLISTYTFCQTPSSFDREEVVEVKNTKAKLYANAQTWLTKYYGDYKPFVKFEDKEQGKLVINGISLLLIDYHPDYKYVVTIDVKENKYRYSITNVELGLGPNKTAYTSYYYFGANSELTKYNSIKQQIDSLSASTTTNLSKRELKKHEDLLNKDKEKYKTQAEIVNRINFSLDELISLLKTAMKSNDDF